MFRENSKDRMIRKHMHESDKEKHLNMMSNPEKKPSKSAIEAFKHKPNYHKQGDI